MGGTFITFEGCEGTGKSTQAQLLAQYLITLGYDVVHTAEPGGTQLGNCIREILLDSKIKMTTKVEFLLYESARIEHIQEVIEPSLKANKIVICERFFDSTLAYQGYGRQLPLQFIKSIVQLLRPELIPDITILMDAEIKEDTLKKTHSPDRFESESVDFHRRVRAGYLELAKAYPHRIKVFDATQPQQQLHNAICAYVLSHLK